MEITALPVAPALLGESPFWHPAEQALYWCDIPGHALHRWRPADASHRCWSFDTDVGCAAPVADGTLLLALRSGLVRFDPATGAHTVLAKAPYDTAVERFNDGRADPQGRFWVGTIFEPRSAPQAALYRWAGGRLARVAGGVTVSNGLAFSPDGRTMYWADTFAHRLDALDFDPVEGGLSRQRTLAAFARRAEGQPLASYGGRPDGAAVDTEGHVWLAMFEGQRLVRLAPDGTLVQELPLPVRCPTMPCFGGDDLKTLYITTARHNRPADELAAQPLAGCVLALRVPVAGLPVNFVRA
jgi:sugar lactone lactonase YvrE